MEGIMDLLFKREQSPGRFIRVQFELWGRIVLDAEEDALMKRYRFHDAILIAAIQPNLLKKTGGIFIGAFIVANAVVSSFTGMTMTVLLSLVAATGAAYWYFNEKRETIMVKDLLNGRYFKCDSIVDLARKEAWLETVVAYLRQVMETAKHWDGTAKHKVEPLPKEEARQVILRGL